MTPTPIRPNDLRQRLPNGSVLDGVYAIEGEIGAGGFGITYRCRDITLGHAVAVKEYFPSDIGNRDSTMSIHPASQAFGQVFLWGREGFVREAQMLAGFRHPNIVRVLRYFEANNTAYMALEFEEGPSLSRWLDRQGGLPSQADLDRISAGLCDALTLIHGKRLIHRDIAPDNIIVRPDGSPVLLDFGAARYEVADQTRASGRSAHTTSFAIIKAHYSPFEQRSTDTTRRGPWSDVYAVGATLYRAVVGKVPMDAADRMAGDSDTLTPAAEAARGIYRPGFLAAIDKALALKPGDRPQSIAAFRALAFRDAETAAGATAAPDAGGGGRVVPHKVIGFTEVADQRARTTPPPRRGLGAMLAAASVALLFALGAMAWWSGGQVLDRNAQGLSLVGRPGPDARGQSATAKPAAPADATQVKVNAEADARSQRQAAEARERAEQPRAEQQRAEQQRAEQLRNEQLASAERQAAEVRTQREVAERTAADLARRTDEVRRLEEEAARLRRSNEQARLEQADSDRRRAEEAARMSREREIASEAALQRERAARAAAEAKAAAEGAGDQPAGSTDAVSGGPSLWNHNGSIMRLVAQGAERTFVYETPRPGIRDEGVTPGTVLFRGSKSGNAYAGTASVFRRGCGARGYEVAGVVADDQKSVRMVGRAPRINERCEVTGYLDDTLIFEFQEVAAVARPVVPPATIGTLMYIERRANFSAKGEGYSTTLNSSYAACEARCLGDAACRSFEFYRPQSKCNLYANVPLDGPTKDADIGIKRQGTPPAAGGAAVVPAATGARIARQPNRFFEGDGYRKVNGSSFHACESLCLADASCKAIELHRKGNVCQLYATVPKGGATQDADVGVKQ